VKPWFASKVAQSPDAPDLSAEGFTLLGGRIDVVGREPVATIVYQRGQHLVSLSVLDASKHLLPRLLRRATARVDGPRAGLSMSRFLISRFLISTASKGASVRLVRSERSRRCEDRAGPGIKQNRPGLVGTASPMLVV
jgi:hypothetical protein